MVSWCVSFFFYFPPPLPPPIYSFPSFQFSFDPRKIFKCVRNENFKIVNWLKISFSYHTHTFLPSLSLLSQRKSRRRSLVSLGDIMSRYFPIFYFVSMSKCCCPIMSKTSIEFFFFFWQFCCINLPFDVILSIQIGFINILGYSRWREKRDESEKLKWDEIS